MPEKPFSSRNRFLLRLFAVLFSLAAVIAVIETGMRAYGYYNRQNFYRRAVPNEKATDFLLCIGDSHTYGIGAPAGLDYPRQLEALINSRGSKNLYQAINLGRPGFNSSQIVDSALDFLEHDSRRPHAVIFTGGHNNFKNLTNARVLPEEVRKLGAVESARYLFANSRAFRFGEITVSRLEWFLKSRPQQGQGGDAAPDAAVIDARNAGEAEFLTNWLKADLDALAAIGGAHGIPIVLLNYYYAEPWLDEVYRTVGQSPGFLFVSANRLGFSAEEWESASSRYIANGNHHPNQYGYARIAELLYGKLKDRGLPLD